MWVIDKQRLILRVIGQYNRSLELQSVLHIEKGIHIARTVRQIDGSALKIVVLVL